MTRQSPTRDSPDVSRVTKLARRPHRKSRNGCFNCKRRKVKCDEVKPACANCIRFGIPCDFAPASPSSSINSLPGGDAAGNIGGDSSSIPRRGPGRPRKDWASITRPPQQQGDNVTTTSPSSTADTPVTNSSYSTREIQSCSLNVPDTELLLHFISTTGKTLTHSDHDDDSLNRFWSRNVPKLGVSHHFVLHFIYALAGYHLAFSGGGEGEPRQYLSLASHHSAIGLSELNRALPSLDKNNCGALYISAVLVCYCTFAAGPTSMNDLLVCDVSDGAAQRWLPLIHGVRLIRQTIEPATLFTGLMEPLGGSERAEETGPSCFRDGLPRVDWIEPLDKLRKWISSHETPDTIIFSRSLESLAEVYDATYGDQNGRYNGPPNNQFVFGWLYRMSDPFVACIRQKKPLALLILAYFAPLLKGLRSCWFLDGWPEHLLNAIGDMLPPDLSGWLQWPMEISQIAS